MAELTAAETQHAQAIHEQEAEQDRLTQRIYALDAELRQNQNVLNQTTLEVDRSENRIAFNQTRSAELAGRNEQIVAERAALIGSGGRVGIAQSCATTSRGNGAHGIGDIQARVEELASLATARASAN